MRPGVREGHVEMGKEEEGWLALPWQAGEGMSGPPSPRTSAPETDTT